MSELKLTDSQFYKIHSDDFSKFTPESWAFADFELLVEDQTNSKLKLLSSEVKEEGIFPVIDQGQKFISGYSDKASLLRSFDQPVIVFGDHTRSFKFIEFPFIQGADGTKVLKPLKIINTKFVFYYLTNIRIPDKGYSRHFKYLKAVKLPIPPSNEQKRIVQKIESTQSKIKVIEDNVTKAEALIEKYRESLLQKAFRGELVSQNPNDEPASELLMRIRAEKDKQADGKKKKKDELPPIKEDEIPFEIPKNWEWVRLGEIITLYSGQHIEEKDYNNSGNGTPYLTGPSDFGDIYPVVSKWTTRPKVIAPANSILITVKGSGVGKTNLNRTQGICISRQLMAAEPQDINLQYLNYFIIHSFKEISAKAQGLIPGLSREDIVKLSFPLPSIIQQNRIVEVLLNKFRQLDELKIVFQTIKLELNKNNKAILTKAFEGSLVSQIPSEGTGHNLLKEILSKPTADTVPINKTKKEKKK